MEQEVWKPVVGYEGLYEVSNLGRVKSLNYNHTGKEKVLAPGDDKYGYRNLVLWKNRTPKNYKVHRIVADAFIENPENKPCIDHINAIRDDNRVVNLRWCTESENRLNPITRRRSSEALKGRKASPETRKKMSEAQKGKESPNRKLVLATDKEGYQCVFFSIKDASEELGISASGICQCLKGRFKSIKGYTWQYYTKESEA